MQNNCFLFKSSAHSETPIQPRKIGNKWLKERLRLQKIARKHTFCHLLSYLCNQEGANATFFQQPHRMEHAPYWVCNAPSTQRKSYFKYYINNYS